MKCPECNVEHDGSYSRSKKGHCCYKCYQKEYQREYKRNVAIERRRKKSIKREVTEEEAYTRLFEAVIRRAVDDATGKGFQVTIAKERQREIKREAREWLVEELPYTLALVRDMDIEDIDAMKKTMAVWVRCGCPRDGSFGI